MHHAPREERTRVAHCSLKRPSWTLFVHARSCYPRPSFPAIGRARTGARFYRARAVATYRDLHRSNRDGGARSLEFALARSCIVPPPSTCAARASPPPRKRTRSALRGARPSRPDRSARRVCAAHIREARLVHLRATRATPHLARALCAARQMSTHNGRAMPRQGHPRTPRHGLMKSQTSVTG